MYEIADMKREHIAVAQDLWQNQFNKYCGGLLPDFLPGGEGVLHSYLAQQIDRGNALVARKDGELAGYIAWMCFDFHGDRTAFCPIIGHGAALEDETTVYRELYAAASRRWVLDNRFNHLWMTFFHDILLKEMLYDYGFGSYVVDACVRVPADLAKTDCAYRIVPATAKDAGKLLHYANGTEPYYRDAPIFLNRGLFTQEEILAMIEKEHVLLALDGEKIIGVMGFSTGEPYHFERLTGPGSAHVTGVGGHILPEYRGCGIGTRLVQEMLARCAAAGKGHVHVSFESANPYAMRFWPKHFHPVIRSVRRMVNKDANP